MKSSIFGYYRRFILSMAVIFLVMAFGVPQSAWGFSMRQADFEVLLPILEDAFEHAKTLEIEVGTSGNFSDKPSSLRVQAMGIGMISDTIFSLEEMIPKARAGAAGTIEIDSNEFFDELQVIHAHYKTKDDGTIQGAMKTVLSNMTNEASKTKSSKAIVGVSAAAASGIGLIAAGAGGGGGGGGTPPSPVETICDDNIDNDLDGQADCDDADCGGDPICQPVLEICNDNLDNDGDGLIDCCDIDDCFDPNCNRICSGQ